MAVDVSSAAGRAVLESAVAVARSVPERDPVRRAASVRARLAGLPVPGDLTVAELATAALTQVELRDRAAAKFGAAAERMWFTAAGLEQSTRSELADHRAARFAAAGVHAVLDLGCGIGGDALGMLRHDLSVTAVERDPATAAVAAANLATALADRAPGAPPVSATVQVCDAERSGWPGAEAVFLDPARRAGARRTFDPHAFSPSLDFVLAVLAEVPVAAAKLAPGLDHALVPGGLHAEWVSFAGGVKEAVLYTAAFELGPAHRSAVALPEGVRLSDTDAEELALGGVAEFVHEPDGAFIRAGLVTQVAAALGARRLDEHLAYLTGDRPADSCLARSYRVLDVADYSLKRLAAELRRREVGVLEIKKRGVDVDPAVLRRQLRLRGTASMTVVLARVGSRRLAVLAEPVR